MEIRLQIPNIPTTTRYNPLNAVIADDGQIWTGGVLRDVCDWFARVTQLTESLWRKATAHQDRSWPRRVGRSWNCQLVLQLHLLHFRGWLWRSTENSWSNRIVFLPFRPDLFDRTIQTPSLNPDIWLIQYRCTKNQRKSRIPC